MGPESADFHPNSAFPDCNSSFELTDGYEMMHKAWSNIEEVLYCFQGHPSNTKVALKQKYRLSPEFGRFQTVTSAWIGRWLRNNIENLM